MIGPTLFEGNPPDPGDDATPLAGGAGVYGSSGHQHHTRSPQIGPTARRDAPATSHEAAARIREHAPVQRERVLGFIAGRGAAGAIDAEIEAGLGLRAQSVSPRRGELVRLGLVRDSGARRPTPSGRRAIVWVAIEGARAEGGAP